MEPSVKSYRIVFSKTGRIRFVGHLDLTQALRRAIKRANIPVKFSAGFNPHMEFAVAMPLSLGMEGLGEFADIMINDESGLFDAAKIAELLKETVMEGIEILGVYPIPSGAKSSAASIEKAEYTVELPLVTDFKFVSSRIDEMISADEIIVIKKTKKAETSADIREDIFELEANEKNGKVSVRMIIAAGSLRNLKPSLVMKHLMTDEVDAKYTRNRLMLSGQN